MQINELDRGRVQKKIKENLHYPRRKIKKEEEESSIATTNSK